MYYSLGSRISRDIFVVFHISARILEIANPGLHERNRPGRRHSSGAEMASAHQGGRQVQVEKAY